MITDQKQPKLAKMEILPPNSDIPIRHEKRKSAKTDEKHAAYLLLLEQGLEPMKAAQVLGYNPKTAYELNKKLNVYEKKKDRLLTLAVNGLEKFMQGKPINGVTPKCSTIKSAIDSALDRLVPIVHKSVNLTGQVSISPVDLLEYMGSEKKQ